MFDTNDLNIEELNLLIKIQQRKLIIDALLDSKKFIKDTAKMVEEFTTMVEKNHGVK